MRQTRGILQCTFMDLPSNEGVLLQLQKIFSQTLRRAAGQNQVYAMPTTRQGGRDCPCFVQMFIINCTSSRSKNGRHFVWERIRNFPSNHPRGIPLQHSTSVYWLIIFPIVAADKPCVSPDHGTTCVGASTPAAAASSQQGPTAGIAFNQLTHTFSNKDTGTVYPIPRHFTTPNRDARQCSPQARNRVVSKRCIPARFIFLGRRRHRLHGSRISRRGHTSHPLLLSKPQSSCQP
mmetsp:Transcript_481/g.1041  ORF Transcript_481/g.1041 Transcript_481/m.1041 type:complete len:234 (-) Transcript_481:219-920(-)